MAIRWKEGELDDLRREIARYNRKIDRLRKKGVDTGMGSLPERGKIRDVKKMTSRAELNAYKRSMARFMKPGSEALVTTKGGLVIPKYERAEINALNARINARRRKTFEAAQKARSAGDLPLMGRIKDNEARPRRGLQSVTPAGYAEYKRVAFKEGAVKYPQLKKELYRKNYMKMIDNLFSVRDARKIKAALKNIPLDRFINRTINEEEISFSIGSPPATGADTVSARMVERFEKVFPNEFKNVKLKDVKYSTEADEIIWEDEDEGEWYE